MLMGMKYLQVIRILQAERKVTVGSVKVPRETREV
jgi:hypothetical protein